MDKTPEYIEMCKKAHEIQKLWHPERGDVTADEKGRIDWIIPENHRESVLKKGMEVHSENGVIHLAKLTWLPRQSQLMEIGSRSGLPFRDISFAFFEWTKKDYDDSGRRIDEIFATLEQLWLAFIMKNIYRKKWSEGQWIKTV